jgi:hypothetical protein
MKIPKTDVKNFYWAAQKTCCVLLLATVFRDVLLCWQRTAFDAYLITLVRNLPQKSASAPIPAGPKSVC